MKTLKLFNAVIAKNTHQKPFVSEKGLLIESDAMWAQKKIEQFYKNENLDGFGLNNTFHKSWKTILKGSREKLWMEQIRHYISTYGSNFQEQVYIPDEVLNVPEMKITFKVIKAYTREEMTAKCLHLLQSGVALKEETINDLLSILVDELAYDLSQNNEIKNKEAIIKIADQYDILPSDTLLFFRYIIYKATGESLLIKSNEMVEAIKSSYYNPSVQFEKFGLEKLAEVFNRFKPLFLAFKSKCPKTINKISKLSKTLHKPMVANPLNFVTSRLLSDSDEHWLNNATPFALFKALAACHTRMEGQKEFVYRIRNGKSYATKSETVNVVWPNYYFLLEYLKYRYDLSDKKFFFPKDIDFALPTSEKMYVGNIPTGSKFYGESLAVGVYWENQWGAHDLDLSGLNISGKIGWNADYKQGNGELMYSGDMTDATSGAVEYLYAQNGLNAPTLVNNNVFDGKGNCEYKIIVGKGDQVNYDYMMNPNNLFVETKSQSVQRQTVLGMLLPEKGQQCFVLLNFGAGESRVSGNSETSTIATKALYQQWNNTISFNELIVELGGEIVSKSKNAEFDFSLNKLQKDSFMKIFNS